MLFEPHGIFECVFGLGGPVRIGELLNHFTVARHGAVEVTHFAVDVAHLEHREVTLVGADLRIEQGLVHL